MQVRQPARASLYDEPALDCIAGKSVGGAENCCAWTALHRPGERTAGLRRALAVGLHDTRREVRSMGDGFMVALASARWVVACAFALQQAPDDQNRQQQVDPDPKS